MTERPKGSASDRPVRGGRGPAGHDRGSKPDGPGRRPKPGGPPRGPTPGGPDRGPRPGGPARGSRSSAPRADAPSRGGGYSAPAGEPPVTPGTGADDLSDLTALGREAARPSRRLETFPNKHMGRRYTVTLVCPEFTCLCPVTGQPDFATITVRYVPDRRIVESKSLKLYLWSFRGEGHFHEHVTNIILDDLVRTLDPVSCDVMGAFNVRGGIGITVDAHYAR